MQNLKNAQKLKKFRIFLLTYISSWDKVDDQDEDFDDVPHDGQRGPSTGYTFLKDPCPAGTFPTVNQDRTLFKTISN